MKKTSIILATILMSFSLAGCANGGDSTKTGETSSITDLTSVAAKVKVIFDYNGGVPGEGDPLELELDKNQTIDNIPEPTKEYCIFQGWWSRDGQLTPETKIKKDTTFIAKWEEHYPTYDGHLMFFELDAHIKATVYVDKACTTVDTNPDYQTRNKDTGEISKEDTEFYFALEFDAGYELNTINFRPTDGAWSGEILLPADTRVDTNKDNCYRVTKVTSNGAIVVTAKQSN